MSHSNSTDPSTSADYASTWRTIDQVLELRPFLTERTVRTWRDTRRLRYSRRGAGTRATALYRLCDIDQLVESFVVEPTRGPLAKADKR